MSQSILSKAYGKLVEFIALTGIGLVIIGIVISFLTSDRGLIITLVLGGSVLGGLFLFTYGLVSAQEKPHSIDST